MTPALCNRFCRRHGHSLAMVKQRTQCVCMEYSQVTSWNKTRFSCSIPCAGDEETFCGGKEAYSTYSIMPGALFFKEFLIGANAMEMARLLMIKPNIFSSQAVFN